LDEKEREKLLNKSDKKQQLIEILIQGDYFTRYEGM